MSNKGELSIQLVACLMITAAMLVFMCIAVFIKCSNGDVYEAPFRIVKRERIVNDAAYEVWRISEYRLHCVRYDTLYMRDMYDTAHELPGKYGYK